LWDIQAHHSVMTELHIGMHILDQSGVLSTSPEKTEFCQLNPESSELAVSLDILCTLRTVTVFMHYFQRPLASTWH